MDYKLDDTGGQESGKCNPMMEPLVRLARLYKVSADWLLPTAPPAGDGDESTPLASPEKPVFMHCRPAPSRTPWPDKQSGKRMEEKNL